MVAGVRGGMGGRGNWGVWDRHTLMGLKWTANKDLLYSTWNSTQCCVVAWMGGRSGGEWIYVYVWLGHFTVHLKLPQHC